MSASKRVAPCAANTVLPTLSVPSAQQWLSVTAGRVAPDGYSWMQTVHWVVSSGCYTPSWRGPREMGLSTIRVAQELAALSPCRPGVEFLARKLRLTERTVQNHLRMLRESGLLVYVERGTRHRGVGARASEFALVIPPQFDAALGIRTVGEGPRRRMTGIAEAGREVMARLGAKAAKKWRAARPKRKSSARPSAVSSATTLHAAARGPVTQASQAPSDASAGICRCTPMEGGCSSCPSDRPTLLPPESKLVPGEPGASAGEHQQQEPGAKPKCQVLNRVGRRHQLAFELVQQVPWLGAAAVPRIAWVARHVADAGWTATEVIAWLEVTANASRIRRPSAYLAHRLRGAHLIWDTDAKRATGVLTWRDSLRSAADRHAEWGGNWASPRSTAARRLVNAAQQQLTAGPQDPGATWHSQDDPLGDPLGLSPAEILDLRAAGERDHSLVRGAIALLGEDTARRVYSHRIVDLVQAADQAVAVSFRMVVHATPWEGR